ncbi:CLUMA_CG006966, isoform A [Clunio marinus]|uniref:CLUMA_CG006966, isoform A n=1 Tax=Clunio marinus TaxID=568069 RepID=A0A1J1I3I8_9DIPT|nr:CLUMA_CG006966, isoform A [Clunio marinus]
MGSQDKKHKRSCQRLERKKNKLAALANIMEVNERDREIKKAHKRKYRPENEETLSIPSTSTESNLISYNEMDTEILNTNQTQKALKKFFNSENEGTKVTTDMPDTKKVKIGLNDDYNSLKKKVDAMTKQSKSVPKFRLKFFGDKASLLTKEENRQPLIIIEELSFVPLTQSHKEKLVRDYGSLEAAINLNKDHHLIYRSVFPIDGDITSNILEMPEGETFPRTRLLLSPLQMMVEGYPMPLKGEFLERYRDYRKTKESYKPVTSQSAMFGLDCEMCRTDRGQNELTRVSIVNENYKSIYETLVRPENKIVDYLTQWSGITKEMMKAATKTLSEVQEEVCDLLPPDAILVGQSLNCDLNAMRLMHPYVIDTSVIFNVTGDRNRKTKLKELAKCFLGEKIQTGFEGHDSIEDSKTSLRLTKLKLSKDIYFGDVALISSKSFPKDDGKIISTGIVNETNVNTPQVATNMISQAMRRRKKSAIITTYKSDLNLEKFYSKNQFDVLQNETDGQDFHGINHIKETSAKKVVRRTQELLMDYDFSLSHFNVDDFHTDLSSDGSDSMEKLIPQIDTMIENLWNNVSCNGLMVVILGGHEKNPNGVTMVRVKP